MTRAYFFSVWYFILAPVFCFDVMFSESHTSSQFLFPRVRCMCSFHALHMQNVLFRFAVFSALAPCISRAVLTSAAAVFWARQAIALTRAQV